MRLELLKETGHASLIVESKYRIVMQLDDRLIEVKYNKIRQLGSQNGDRVRLIEVTA